MVQRQRLLCRVHQVKRARAMDGITLLLLLPPQACGETVVRRECARRRGRVYPHGAFSLRATPSLSERGQAHARFTHVLVSPWASFTPSAALHPQPPSHMSLTYSTLLCPRCALLVGAALGQAARYAINRAPVTRIVALDHWNTHCSARPSPQEPDISRHTASINGSLIRPSHLSPP